MPFPHFRERVESHGQTGGENHECARSREERGDAAVEPQPPEGAAREHGDEPDASDRQRQAGAERDHEQHPERDAVQGDRSQ